MWGVAGRARGRTPVRTTTSNYPPPTKTAAMHSRDANEGPLRHKSHSGLPSLVRPGRFVLGSTLKPRQKCARGRDELVYRLDESLQPGVLLLHLAIKRIVIRAVRGIHVIPSGRPANPRRSPFQH